MKEGRIVGKSWNDYLDAIDEELISEEEIGIFSDTVDFLNECKNGRRQKIYPESD